MSGAYKSYQSVTELEEANKKVEAIFAPVGRFAHAQFLALWYTVFAVSFLFYGYCIYHALAPLELFLELEKDDNSWHRQLTDANDAGTNEKCTPTEASGMAAIGGAVGGALVATSFLAIGLTPLGPIAGGLFAANMGAGLAAGTASTLNCS